jgi:tRNA threonylcarbamoyl adenosine modification protein YeaZ
MTDGRVVLAIDTSTVVNVGLAHGAQVLATATIEDRMAHVEQLTPLIRDCLAEAGLRLTEVDQIVVGLGPGPFTGLRVGIVTAQTLAAVGGHDLHGICSLDVLAAQYAAQCGDQASADFVVATDARRREVYWAAYAADGRRLGAPQVGPPLEVPRRPTVGPAAAVYPDQLMVAPGPRILDPRVLATAGPGLPDAGSTPLYLRRPDATEPTRRKSVLPLSARGVRR